MIRPVPVAEALQEAVSIGSIKALVITHLTPRRVDSLVQLLKLRAGQSTKLEVFLTNPALQALQTLLGETCTDTSFRA